MASLVLAGNTSGSITISSPSVSGSNTLSLPANTGTVITTGSTGQVINQASLPTGSVLQVVNATYGTATSSSSTSFSATGLTASITPKFSTSKILVIVNQNGIATGTAFTGMSLQLLRGATDLTLFATQTSYQTISLYTSAGTSYLDSPATTSATTYSTSQALTYGAGTVISQSANAVSTITLMEIAA